VLKPLLFSALKNTVNTNEKVVMTLKLAGKTSSLLVKIFTHSEADLGDWTSWMLALFRNLLLIHLLKKSSMQAHWIHSKEVFIQVSHFSKETQPLVLIC